MADWADEATAISDMHLSESIRRARQPVPAGAPGVCEYCDEKSLRLVGGLCEPCREPRRNRRG